MARDSLISRPVGRRRFLVMSMGSGAALALAAACGTDENDNAGATATAPPEPDPTPRAPAQGQAIVGDVLDHAIESEDWTGDYGFVTFRLHEASVDGDSVYFIRTDASDREFAEAEELVYVPIMAEALASGAGLGSLFVFENGGDGQLPVMSSAPHMPDFSPAFRLHRVNLTGDAGTLTSVDAIREAEADGLVSVEETDIVVNYPVVKWPGGEMPHDEELTEYLGGGQLIEPVDVAGRTVTFKLHACYPSLRYIVTDVTIPEMAEGMNIAPAPGAVPLTEEGATAKILVFGNGVEGSGPMGFQKSVVDTVVGDAAWSPFWDHYTFVWDDAAQPTVLRTEAEILDAEAEGMLARFGGTPETDPMVFMVNCPAPVVAAIPE
jgi:hypothetical protein